MNLVDVISGDSPVVLGMPHTGTYVPDGVYSKLNANGQKLADTDWHIDKLYDGLLEGATIVRANFHRYVIDANRDPSGKSLYPGQNTTSFCPLTDFDGEAIYLNGQQPNESDIAQRIVEFHAPYHAALAAELEKAREKFGVAILYDCHSIRSDIPFLFDGRLPDFNIGTNEGQTCAPEIEQFTHDICKGADDYTSVLNGRFKGGWTTRHYGHPEIGVHAIQMELTQCQYLESEQLPFNYSPEKAVVLRVHLKNILNSLSNWALELNT
jgi:N-formylglutamate deformylase